MPLLGLQMTLGRWLPSSRVGCDMPISIGWPDCKVRMAENIPTSDKTVQNTIHIRADPSSSSNRQIRDKRQRQTVGCVIGADRVLRFQIVQFLRIVGSKRTYPRIAARGRIIGGLRKRVPAFKADVVAGAFLEAYLQRIVEGFRLEQRKAFKVAVELRVWTQQVDKRDLVVVIQRVGLVERLRSGR